MAIGKGSLERVAGTTVIGAPSAAIEEKAVKPVAKEKKPPVAPEVKKATAATKESTVPKKTAPKTTGNVRYAVGDALPEYLL